MHRVVKGLVDNPNGLTVCLLGNFICLFCRQLFFSKSTFSKYSFRNTIRVTNSTDPDQTLHNVGSDLGPDCLQQLSDDDPELKVVLC